MPTTAPIKSCSTTTCAFNNKGCTAFAITVGGDAATAAFEGFGHARALEVTESFFWTFCDDYIELVKDRANDFDGSHAAAAVRSARATLAIAVDTFVRLLAPFLPFATSVLTRSLESGHYERTGAVFYGLVMVVGGLFFNALWRTVIRDRRRLRPEVTEAEVRVLAASSAAFASSSLCFTASFLSLV